MSHDARVLESLETGLNCAESMVAAFADAVGMPRDAGIRSATGLGAGMGRTGNVCGLVSGSVLILGWVFGRCDPADSSAKERAYQAVADLVRAVEALRGSILCTDLLGADLSTEEGRLLAADQKLFKMRCRATSAEIVEILERLLASSGS